MIQKKNSLFLCGLLFLILGIQVYNIDISEYSLCTDRTFYRDVLFTFIDKVFVTGFDSYYLNKIFPFAVINSIYELFDISKTDISFLYTLLVVNIGCIVASVYLFFLIVKKLKINESWVIIGFSMLFFNVHILGVFHIGFVGSDYWGYLMGFVLFWIWLSVPNMFVRFFVVLLSAYVAPLLVIVAICLFYFPDKPVELFSDNIEKKSLLILRTFKVVAVVAIIPLILALLYLKTGTFNINQLESLYHRDWYSHFYLNPLFLLFSVASLIFVLYLMIKPIKLDICDFIRTFVSNFKTQNFLLIIFALFIILFLNRLMSNGESSWGILGLAKYTVTAVTALPFEILSFQFRYHGLLVILMILFYKKVLSEYAYLGYGYFFVILLGLVFVLPVQPRYIESIVPFFVFPLLKLMNQYQLKKWVPIVVSLISLLFSRFWLSDIENLKWIEGAGCFQYFDVYIVFLFIGSLFLFITYLGIRNNWFTKNFFKL